MILVIRHLVDPVADILAQALGPRLRSLYIEGWLAGCTITHTVGAAGVTTQIEQAGVAVLLNRSTAIVLNRTAFIPVPAFHGASPADRDYAMVEATATFWSCLEGLCCPVLNGVAALRMAGHAQSEYACLGQAVCAGLNTRALRMTTRATFNDSACARSNGRPAEHIVVGAPAYTWAPDAGEQGELWIVGDQVLGALEGVPPAAAQNFARRVGLGFGVLRFVRLPAAPWRWASFDALPLDAPAAVIEALIKFVARHATEYAQGEST